MNLTIRSESQSDYLSITMVNDLAFGQQNEGLLVEKLRKNQDFIKELSIVALFGGEVVGHILFFPVSIDNGILQHRSLALAPVSVLPEFQNMGIGSQLIQVGLKKSAEAGFHSVIVLGHPDYYLKFGFKPASLFDIKAPFEIPEDVFMAKELVPDGLSGVSGVVVYPDEYRNV
ncbi:MAG TPA: N-acetyltransferase [Bacteroidales bacterium]|nr:N-acetyltransferase [Bacteroidales bacterium]